MSSQIKTTLLLTLLSGIILFMGRALGGNTGLFLAFGIALVMNVGSYWFSDKIVLKMYKAKELSVSEAPLIHAMVEELAANAGIPKPRICIVPESSPNAFATGRNPDNAVVAVTEGIVQILSPEELKGVLAHELGHIANRDILIQTVASVMGTVIMYLANFVQFSAIMGGRNSREGSSGVSAIGALLVAMLAPLAASVIQMSLSRAREYLADESGAHFSGTPAALASALAKISNVSQQIPMHEGTPATANMFIINPFFPGGLRSLFSTHPPVEERIRRLEAMAAGKNK